MSSTTRPEGTRAYRLYKEEKLDLRPKHRKRLKSQSRGPLTPAVALNDCWSLDFTSDKLSNGRSFRTLNVIDLFTRRCLGIETDTSLGSERVVRVLEGLVQKHGKPKVLQMDPPMGHPAPSSGARNWTSGRARLGCSCTSSIQASPGRTATSKASTAASGKSA